MVKKSQINDESFAIRRYRIAKKMGAYQNPIIQQKQQVVLKDAEFAALVEMVSEIHLMLREKLDDD